MNRKFYTALLLAALFIAAGSMACVSTINDLDKSDETMGAT